MAAVVRQSQLGQTLPGACVRHTRVAFSLILMQISPKGSSLPVFSLWCLSHTLVHSGLFFPSSSVRMECLPLVLFLQFRETNAALRIKEIGKQRENKGISSHSLDNRGPLFLVPLAQNSVFSWGKGDFITEVAVRCHE